MFSCLNGKPIDHMPHWRDAFHAQHLLQTVAALAKPTVRKDIASGIETDPSYIRRWKKDRLSLYIHKQTYFNREKNCNFCIKPNYANIWRKYTFPWCQTCFHLGWHFQSCWEAKQCLHPFSLKLVWNDEGECYNESGWKKEM